MDPHGVSLFRRNYPNSVGGVAGGRATYIDTHGKGNTFLSSPALARAFIYGDYYDELDISRSHFSAVIGCHSLSHRPHPISMHRYLTEPASLEADIERELLLARPHLFYRLNLLLAAAGGVPNQGQARQITIRRGWLDKTFMKAKNVFSALINAPNPASWQEEFAGRVAICQLVTDIKAMVPSIRVHPLNADYARALEAAGTAIIPLHSLCLANLDEHALGAAARAVQAAGIRTGLTINDSLTISRDHTSHLRQHEILQLAQQAASAHLGYTVSFKYLPALRAADDAAPTLRAVVADLDAAVVPAPGLTPPSSPLTTPPSHSPPSVSPPPSPTPQPPPPDPSHSPPPGDNVDDGAGCFLPRAHHPCHRPAPSPAPSDLRLHLVGYALPPPTEVYRPIFPVTGWHAVQYGPATEILACRPAPPVHRVLRPRAIRPAPATNPGSSASPSGVVSACGSAFSPLRVPACSTSPRCPLPAHTLPAAHEPDPVPAGAAHSASPSLLATFVSAASDALGFSSPSCPSPPRSWRTLIGGWVRALHSWWDT